MINHTQFSNPPTPVWCPQPPQSHNQGVTFSQLDPQSCPLYSLEKKKKKREKTLRWPHPLALCFCRSGVGKPGCNSAWQWPQKADLSGLDRADHQFRGAEEPIIMVYFFLYMAVIQSRRVNSRSCRSYLKRPVPFLPLSYPTVSVSIESILSTLLLPRVKYTPQCTPSAG